MTTMPAPLLGMSGATTPPLIENPAGVLGVLLAAFSGGLTYVLLQTGTFGSDSDPLTVAVIVSIAAMANLVIAAVAGAGIPVVLRRAGQDPALASSIFLTLITDVVGFGGFLVVAVLLL